VENFEFKIEALTSEKDLILEDVEIRLQNGLNEEKAKAEVKLSEEKKKCQDQLKISARVMSSREQNYAQMRSDYEGKLAQMEEELIKLRQIKNDDDECRNPNCRDKCTFLKKHYISRIELLNEELEKAKHDSRRKRSSVSVPFSTVVISEKWEPHTTKNPIFGPNFLQPLFTQKTPRQKKELFFAQQNFACACPQIL
jgi:hypothetical protein